MVESSPHPSSLDAGLFDGHAAGIPLGGRSMYRTPDYSEKSRCALFTYPMPLAFRLEADLTRLLPRPRRPLYPPLDVCFGQRLFSLYYKVAVSKCKNTASLTALYCALAFWLGRHCLALVGCMLRLVSARTPLLSPL